MLLFDVTNTFLNRIQSFVIPTEGVTSERFSSDIVSSPVPHAHPPTPLRRRSLPLLRPERSRGIRVRRRTEVIPSKSRAPRVDTTEIVGLKHISIAIMLLRYDVMLHLHLHTRSRVILDLDLVCRCYVTLANHLNPNPNRVFLPRVSATSSQGLQCNPCNKAHLSLLHRIGQIGQFNQLNQARAFAHLQREMVFKLSLHTQAP